MAIPFNTEYDRLVHKNRRPSAARSAGKPSLSHAKNN